MKARLITAVFLITCGLGIGWEAYQNIMWAIWGKQNSWYEYVGFWGCPIMFVSGIVALKTLKGGTYLGLLGYVLVLFYFAPALINTLRRIGAWNLELGLTRKVLLGLFVAVPLLTLMRLCLNVVQIHSRTRA
jgi:hypothetical protein